MGGPGSGKGGLSIAVVRRCQDLIDKGLATIVIARRLGIGDCTVKRIRRGEHFLQLAMDEARLDRCPGCGGLIESQPCLLCEIRKAGL